MSEKPAYADLLPRAFKRFSLTKAFQTIVPTARFYLSRHTLPPSEKPALFTMNILPPMMTVWYHLARKNLGDRVDITIFDCSAGLNKNEFPDATVYKFLNLYAATKSQIFLERIARNRKIGWLCDDDMFFLSDKAVDVVEDAFRDPNTASVSFRPRKWWEFDIDGKRYQPSSSYCIALNRKIFVEKEHLDLGPANGNNHVSIGSAKEVRRYDTFDLANEQLLRKGYRCHILSEDQQEEFVTGFSGLSGAVILLWLFRNTQQTIDYFMTPETRYWKGSMLQGILGAMIAVTFIQDFYTSLTGSPYPLPSLPSRAELEDIYNRRKTYLADDQSYDWIYKAADVIKENL